MGSFDEIGTLMEAHLQELGLVPVEREFRFHAKRKWRADFAVPTRRLLIEIDGAVWVQGRHTRGKGYIADMEKRNTAVCEGWRPLTFTPDQVRRGDDLEVLEQFAAIRAGRERGEG